MLIYVLLILSREIVEYPQNIEDPQEKIVYTQV
jgi:hypothetical protein